MQPTFEPSFRAACRTAPRATCRATPRATCPALSAGHPATRPRGRLLAVAVAVAAALAAAAPATPAAALEPAPGRQPGIDPSAAVAGLPAADAGARDRGEPPPRQRRLEPQPRPGEPLALTGRSTTVHGRVEGHVVVRFAASLAAGEAERIAGGAGGRAVHRARFAEFSRVEVPPGTTPEELVERLRGLPGVVWAEIDPLVRAAYSRTAAALAPTDPLYPRQWHLHRIGLEEALDRNPTNGAGVIVAVVDSGVAFGGGAAFPARTAPDLEGTHVLPGLDLVAGGPPWDEGTAADPDRPFQSLRFGHGTFVASVIAATIDNGIAGASVAPRASILPVRVLDVDGFGTTSDVAEGIHFAIREGAKVINLSLGASRGATSMAEAVTAARRAGVVVVAAAGNEAEDDIFDEELGRDVAFPARFPHAIAVGATGFDDRRAPYSNFGPSLDVVAPGGADNREIAGGMRDGVLATSFLHDPRNGETLYGAFWATGTSFAAPHVAGVAALLVALGIDDPEAVRAMIEQTARDLDAPGFDEATAHGLLDAAKAHRGLGFTF